MRSIIFYVVKDLILFASAVASTVTASAEKKHSAVLLNQLLAFATVANIVTGCWDEQECFELFDGIVVSSCSNSFLLKDEEKHVRTRYCNLAANIFFPWRILFHGTTLALAPRWRLVLCRPVCLQGFMKIHDKFCNHLGSLDVLKLTLLCSPRWWKDEANRGTWVNMN